MLVLVLFLLLFLWWLAFATAVAVDCCRKLTSSQAQSHIVYGADDCMNEFFLFSFMLIIIQRVNSVVFEA